MLSPAPILSNPFHKAGRRGNKKVLPLNILLWRCLRGCGSNLAIQHDYRHLFNVRCKSNALLGRKGLVIDPQLIARHPCEANTFLPFGRLKGLRTVYNTPETLRLLFSRLIVHIRKLLLVLSLLFFLSESLKHG